jgi:hypothetical protein
MTEELKTLKDIKKEIRKKKKEQNEFYRLLKAEAVKWIKYLDEPLEDLEAEFSPEQLRQFWLDRFNLTEKDLLKKAETQILESNL